MNFHDVGLRASLIAACALMMTTSARAQDAQVSKAAEEAAFAAVKAKRYCDAMGLFLDAYAIAPDVDLLFNAARAAELGNDRARSLQLFNDVVGKKNASEDRREEARQKIASLTKEVEKKGGGKTCKRASGEAIVMPAPPPPEPEPVKEPPPPPPPPPEDPKPVETTPPPEEPPPPTEPPPTEPPVEPAAAAPEEPGIGMVPMIALGGGGAALAVGALLTIVGAQPWLNYENAQVRLRELEAEGSRDEAGVYAIQTGAEQDWNSYGQATVATGMVLSLVGVGAVATGITLMFLPEDG